MTVLRKRLGRGALLAAAAALSIAAAQARPLTGREGVLPPGTELNEDELDQPTELFYSEKNGGQRTYLSKLGDMLFATPGMLHAGTSLEVFKKWAPHEQNMCILPGCAD